MSHASLALDFLQDVIVGLLPNAGRCFYARNARNIFSKHVCAQPITPLTTQTLAQFLKHHFSAMFLNYFR